MLAVREFDFEKDRERFFNRIVWTENSCYRFPWARQAIQETLEPSPVRKCFLLLEDDSLSGISFYDTVLDEASLNKLSIIPERQGCGLGRILLRESMTVLREKYGVLRFFLDVREGNVPARRLYASQGFTECGIRKNYYHAPQGYENAILMERIFPEEHGG